MSDTSTQDEFFSSGLEHYAEAVQAVEEFQGILRQRVESAMAGQPDSHCTRLSDSSSFRLSTGGKGTDRYFSLFSTMAGEGPESLALEGRLEAGLWWNANFAGAPLVAYVGVSGPSWSKSICAPEGFSGSTHKGYASMYLVQSLEKRDLDETLAELLEHLHRACMAERTKRGG